MCSTPIHPRDNQPETWPGVAASLLVFLIAGLMLILSELPFKVETDPWVENLRGLSFWGMLLVPPVGVAIGWIIGFPRWSYPYASLAVFVPMYFANVSTPGLTFFGYPTFGRQLWGMRACLPLLLGIGVAMLAARSFKPFVQFFTQIGQDWTLGSFALSGTLLLVIFIAYDEIDSFYSLRDMLVLTAMLLLMALIYLRSRTFRLRRLSVGIGISLILGYTAISTTAYWFSLGPENVFIQGMIAWTVILLVFYLSPGIISAFTRAVLRPEPET